MYIYNNISLFSKIKRKKFYIDKNLKKIIILKMYIDKNKIYDKIFFYIQ